MATKGGKILAIPEETQIAMAEMRAAGKTIKEIADFYHVSQNSVLKYTGGVSDDPEPSGVSPELDTDVQDLVLGQHAKRVLNQSKKIDADTVHAGEALREYFKSKGLDVDLRRLPFDQLIKLVKSPGVYEGMNSDVKDVFNDWLMERINKTDTVSEKPDGKMNFSDVKEILMLKFLMKMAGDDGAGPQNQNIVTEMRAENEKQRQFYEKKIDDMESKFRDLIIDRRFQDVEDRQVSLGENLQDQLADISRKIENYRGVALSGNSNEKLDAISHIEKLAAERERVNKAMEKLNQSQVLVTAPPGNPDIYKNSDGSLDFTRYAGDKIESTVKMITEAMSKRAPERMVVKATPAPEQNLTLDQAEQLYLQLTQKSAMTQAESDWVNHYLPVREQYFPSGPDIVPASSSVASSPAYPVELASAFPAKVPAEAASEYTDPAELLKPVEPNKSVIDRLKEKDNSTAQALADLGF